MRLPLFAKCHYPFLKVRAGANAVAKFLIECLTRQRVLGQGVADLLLHGLHRSRAIGRDHLGRFNRPGHEVFSRHDAIDQAELGRFIGGDQFGGQQEFHGLYVANLLNQFDRRPAKGIDRPLHFGQSETRMRRSRSDISSQQQLDPATGTNAVDRRNDRLGTWYRYGS